MSHRVSLGCNWRDVRLAAPYLYLLVPNQRCRVSVNTSHTNMGKMPNKRVQMNQNFKLSSN